MGDASAVSPTLVRLGPVDAGEVLTAQRAAYVTEAQLHDDPHLPPLTQTLAQLRAELGDRAVTALGLRDGSRLVASVRIRVDGDAAVIGRLTVVPDRQGEGLGTRLVLAAEAGVDDAVREVRLFTGEHSLRNLVLYQRLGYRETHRTQAGRHVVVHLAKRR